MRQWDDKRITEWAQEKFGACEPLEIAIRMNKEMSELLSALQNNKLDMALGELADLRIFIAQIHWLLSARLMDYRHLEERVDDKMWINEARRWGLAADGSYQHVE